MVNSVCQGPGLGIDIVQAELGTISVLKLVNYSLRMLVT